MYRPEKKIKIKNKKIKEKKRKEVQRIGQAHVQVHMGIFVIYLSNSSYSIFSPFWWARRKNIQTPQIFFPLLLPTKHPPKKKKFLPIFSPEFSIHPISPPNKNTLSLVGGLRQFLKLKKRFLFLYFIFHSTHYSINKIYTFATNYYFIFIKTKSQTIKVNQAN